MVRIQSFRRCCGKTCRPKNSSCGTDLEVFELENLFMIYKAFLGLRVVFSGFCAAGVSEIAT